jgi:hypothetical protein
MTGERNNRREGKGRNKTDKPTDEELEIRNYWQRTGEPLPVRDYQWRVFAYRGDAPDKKKQLRLDPMVTQISWDDALIQQASITITNPHKQIRLTEGHKVTVLWAHKKGARWHKLWTLRITEVTTDEPGKTMSITAADELEWLKKSRDDFAYRKGEGDSEEKRKQGWLAHQIVRDIAKRYGLKVGHLVKGTRVIEKLVEQNTSPLKVIQKAYEKEREETGYKYVIRMRNGRLNVTRLRRSQELLIYGGQALSATITRRLNKKLVTELSVTGKVEEDGEDAEKREFTIRASRKVRAKYGYVHNFWTADEPAKSIKALRREAKREIADRQEPDKEVALTVPGYPGLHRGDAIKVALKRSGVNELMYVTGASHTVTAGAYETALELSFDEFYIDKEGAEIIEKRIEKAKKKGHKPPKYPEDVFRPGKKRKRKSKKARNQGNR